MPRIRCHYLDCAFLDENYCSAASVELDPDDGCKTFADNTEVSSDEEMIDEQEEEELEEWEETDEEDDGDEDFWPDDE
jgi:hypothetical protein